MKVVKEDPVKIRKAQHREELLLCFVLGTLIGIAVGFVMGMAVNMLF